VAWELLTEVYKIPKERIYVSVFGGDEEEKTPLDKEAFEIWKKILGGEDRIILGSKKDNFWRWVMSVPAGRVPKFISMSGMRLILKRRRVVSW